MPHMGVRRRELGNYENFSLARTNLGTPPIITYIAELERAPSLADVRAVVADALYNYPLLRCSIPEPVAPHPCYAANNAIEPDDIVRVAGASAGMSAADLLVAELDAGAAFDVRAGPLWRVTLYDGADAGGARLALTLNHLLCDGVGARNLLAQLLASLAGGTRAPAAATSAFPPALEATVDHTLSWPAFARMLYTALVRPLLPRALQPPPFWPGAPPARPRTQRVRAQVLEVPAPAVGALKAAGRARGVRTLHPVLHAAALCALDRAVRTERGEAADAPGELVHLRVCTAVSQRDAAAGHPSVTGNYVGAHDTDHALAPASPFWGVARDFAAFLAAPSSVRAARESVGKLAYVPRNRELVGEKQTGREALLERLFDAPAPYAGSLELSNLGLVPDALPGVRGAVFAQTPGAAGYAVTVNLIATRDGPLGIGVTWRDGCVSDAVVRAFCENFMGVVDAIVDGRIGEETTVAACC